MRIRENLNPRRHILNARQSANLSKLFDACMKLQDASGIDLQVNRGFVTLAEQIETYRKINLKRKSQGLPALQVPMESKHMFGAAVDLWDANQQLQKWILANEALVKSWGVHFEKFSYTLTWVHMQVIPPRSGSFFFLPY